MEHWRKKVTNGEVYGNLVTVTMRSIIKTVVINETITALLPFLEPYGNLKFFSHISNR